MPKGVEDLTIGKLESLLHITDIVRGLDARMEMQTLAIFLYVARHNRRGGITMEEIANEVGIAQSSISRGVMKLSDGLINPPREVLDRAANRRRPPTREALKPRFGIGLLYTQDDPYEKRRKIVFLSPMGERIANKLMDYTLASYPMSTDERRKRVRDMKEGKEIHKQERVMEYEQKYMSENLQRLEELQDKIKDQYESIKRELTNRQRDSELTFSELRKRNLLSSGYMREGANVNTKKKR
jgi:DNA-binding MarR family transcriptional regulator